MPREILPPLPSPMLRHVAFSLLITLLPRHAAARAYCFDDAFSLRRVADFDKLRMLSPILMLPYAMLYMPLMLSLMMP